MIYIIILFSFFFEGVVSNIVSPDSILVPLFTLISLSLIWPYFKKNDMNYIITCVIVGLFYDIIYTSMPFLNTVTFLILSLVIMLNYRLFKYNIFSSNIFNIFLVVFYRIISYFILIIIGYLKFDYLYILEKIYSSIIINVIYGVIMFIIIDLIANMFGKKDNNAKIKKMHKNKYKKYE